MTDLTSPETVPGWAHPAWYGGLFAPAFCYADGDDPEPEADPEPEPEGDDPDPEPEPDDKPKPKPPAKKPEPQPGDDDYVPPSKTEWEKTRAALKKANEEAKRHRLAAKEREDAARANEDEHERAVREAREAGEARYRAPLMKAAARAALSEAGVSGSTDRVLRLVDLDALTVDDDGDIVGLEGEVERVKSEYPEFFQSERPKPKPKPTGANRPPAKEKPKSSAEKHAARLLARS